MGSTALSDLAITLDRDTGYSILNYTVSAPGVSSQAISSGPFWTSKALQLQPSTRVTWTTGSEIPYAPILHLVASCSDFLASPPFSFFITTIASTGGSPSPSAKQIITTFSIWTPSTTDIQPWRKT
jgi:hypothetical protein